MQSLFRPPRSLLTLRPARLLAGLIALIGVLVLSASIARQVVMTQTSAPPEPPSALRLVDVTSTGVYLSWQDNSSNEEGFHVYLSGQTEPVARVGANMTKAEVTGLECQSAFQFRVAALNTAGPAFSDVLTVATGICTTLPEPDQSCPSAADNLAQEEPPVATGICTTLPEPDQSCPSAADNPAQEEPPVATPVPPTAVPSPQPGRLPATTEPSTAGLTVPGGYTVYVSPNGCLPDGSCPIGEHPANYYWAPARTAVVCPDQQPWTLRHEACHAHQHLTILQEFGRDPGPPYDLHEWLATGEARDWNAWVTTFWPNYGHWANEPGAHNALEDFAISCGLYFTDPQTLQRIDPIRFAAIEAIFR